MNQAGPYTATLLLDYPVQIEVEPLEFAGPGPVSDAAAVAAP